MSEEIRKENTETTQPEKVETEIEQPTAVEQTVVGESDNQTNLDQTAKIEEHTAEEVSELTADETAEETTEETSEEPSEETTEEPKEQTAEEVTEEPTKETVKKKGFFKRLFTKKNLKWLIISGLALLLAISVAVFFIARSCSNADETTKKVKGYLTLNAYSITLYEGATYELELTKYNEQDESEDVKEVIYTSEVPLVATVDNGTITAVKAGQTNVQITADGLTTACFVTVVEQPKEDGLNIRIVEDVLYKGIPANVYVYVTENGVVSNFTGAITWSVEDASVLSIVDGKVTALKVTDSAKIIAKFTYKGEERTIETTIAVEEPYVYTPSVLEFSLASKTTLSGKVNDKHVSTNITVDRFNPITKETVTLTANDFSVSSRNSNVATVEKDGNTVKVTANATGNTTIDIPVSGTNRSVAIKANVVKTIASVDDMDTLSIAVHSDPELLKSSFIMVSDIDYEGQVIYPIATAYEPYTQTAENPYSYGYSRVIGMQWKYILEIETVNGVDKYKYVDRDLVGKKKEGTETYHGLTDEEFMTLSIAGGLNPGNKQQFKGTFDGNGYTIKNAKLMNDAFLKDVDNFNKAEVTLHGAFPSVFTYVNGGTIKNVGFENISLQSLDDFTVEGWTDPVKPLYHFYCPGKTSQIEKSGSAEGSVINGYRNFNLIAMAWGGPTVNNVYLEMDQSSLSTLENKNIPGGLIHWGKSAKVSNCVVSIKNAVSNASTSMYNASESGTFNNNITIGTKVFGTNYTGALLENGNAWISNSSWQDLKAIVTDQIINTFDAKVWDMTDFISGTGAPKLKNGCSL